MYMYYVRDALGYQWVTCVGLEVWSLLENQYCQQWVYCPWLVHSNSLPKWCRVSHNNIIYQTMHTLSSILYICTCVWYRWDCSGNLQWCWCHCLTPDSWAVSNENVRLHTLTRATCTRFICMSSVSPHGAGMRWPSWCTGAMTHRLSLMMVQSANSHGGIFQTLGLKVCCQSISNRLKYDEKF